MAQICNVTHSISGGGVAGFYIDYSITDYPDRVVISSSAVISAMAASNGGSFMTRITSSTSGWYVNGNQYLMSTGNVSSSVYNQTVTATVGSAQTTVYKTKSAQNISVVVSVKIYAESRGMGTGSNTSRIWTDEPTSTIPISAKTSYTVSFDANGGENPPANQTKWYGEALTIQDATPKKDGYTFLGWATSTANASSGTVDYAVGSSYTANAGAVLYAVWELTYEKPKIPSSSIHIDRCKQNGQSDDDGGYALVTFNWSIFKSSLARYYGGSTAPYSNNSVSNCTVTVGTRTATKTLTGASGTAVPVVVGNDTFDPDTPYNVTISITDSQTTVTDHTTTVTGILPKALFPMDFNADATAVGFFTPAPDDSEGAYFGKDIYVYVETGTVSGTDGQINQALSDLGWTDVLS